MPSPTRLEAGYLTEPDPKPCRCGHDAEDHWWSLGTPGDVTCLADGCDCTDYDTARYEGD